MRQVSQDGDEEIKRERYKRTNNRHFEILILLHIRSFVTAPVARHSTATHGHKWCIKVAYEFRLMLVPSVAVTS